MDFVALTLGMVAVLFLILVGLARAFQDHSVADLIDWKPTRSPEVEAQNEVDDVAQMIAAQNEYRRKRGAKEITEADVQRQAQEDQAVRARGRGPFAQGGGLDDDLGGVKPKPAKSKPRTKAAAPAKKPMATPKKRTATTDKRRATAKKPTATTKKRSAKPKKP